MKTKWIITITITIVLAIVIIIYVRSMKKPNKTIDITQFYPELYKWLSKKEGGKTGDPDDPNSENAAPGTGGIHTNRGVAWKTFNGLAPKLGYTPTVELFLAMPQDLWEKIVRYHIALGETYSNNPVLATYIGLWYWGTGSIDSGNSDTIKNILATTPFNKKALEKIVDLRKQFFVDLGKRKPHLAKYVPGWINRANSFYTTFSPYV